MHALLTSAVYLAGRMICVNSPEYIHYVVFNIWIQGSKL